jgi:type VI secretion system secreted protein VgrG
VGDEVVITCGQSSFTMKKDGTIILKGKEITIDAMQKIDEKAMNITSEASAKNMTKGAMVNVEASGVNTIKGSLVKIN